MIIDSKGAPASYQWVKYLLAGKGKRDW